MIDIVTVLKRTQEYFRKQGIDSARIDAEILLCHCLELNRMQLYLQFDRPLTEQELERIRPLVRRRGNREPVAWIIGSKGFYEHEFIVKPNLLCPRPDTETLVQTTLELIPEDKEYFIADIGCGTGCIGLSILLARPKSKLYAVDISQAAIDCTKENVQKFSLSERVAVLRGEYLNPIPKNRSIDILVSNPPYIPSKDIDDLQPEVSQHEPRIALDGGTDGLSVYNILIPKAAERVRVAVAVEVGFDQASQVAEIMTRSGLRDINIQKDLSGTNRVVVGLK
jgi:release factor glutamine methyltransferase